MDSIIEKSLDGTITLTITIPNTLVKKTLDELVEEITKEASVSGFRKGKAPEKIVKEKVNKDKLREDALKKLLPQAYSEAINKHNIRPIMNPRIHVQSLEEGKDWKFTAQTCETPVVELGKYKENVKKITAKSKIVIPGKEEKPVSLDEIITELLKNTTISIPKIIIDQEVERLLAQTLDEIKKLGLTLDQYLSSTNKTVESMQAELAKKAETDIQLEFALQKIAEEEKITVEDKEITDTIGKAKDDTERKNLEGNRYLLASIIRQQKTLDFLKNL
ncbi:MAG: hypothetical protein HYT08_00190 [Candidatus Levybacteria bacterium]|nr:hypothetical protein [Candidatus Levybacteria bacterium]